MYQRIVNVSLSYVLLGADDLDTDLAGEKFHGFPKILLRTQTDGA